MSNDRAKIKWNGWGWAAHREALTGREEIWTWLAEELGMPSLLATPARPLEDIVPAPPRLDEATRAKLVEMLGLDRVRDDAYERAFHALGRSYHDLLRLRSGDLSTAPDAVLYPRAAEEVLALLAFCSERDIAVVPYGGGTSVVGGVSGAPGAFPAVVTLDMSGMDRLTEVDTTART